MSNKNVEENTAANKQFAFGTTSWWHRILAESLMEI